MVQVASLVLAKQKGFTRRQLDVENEIDLGRLHGGTGQLNLEASGESTVNLPGKARQLNIGAGGSSTVNVYDPVVNDPERVPPVGSLPPVRRRNPDAPTSVPSASAPAVVRSPFRPATDSHRRLWVDPGSPAPAGPDAAPDEQGKAPDRRRVFSSATSLTAPLKATLWNVMSGGAAGSAARSLQDAHSLTTLFHQHLGTAITSLVLAVILSSAAIVLAARKSEAQSFITVEECWGGVLIGFLIVYSGTAAFTELTGVSS
ncbi:hypothetical protein [Streptomyces sp. NPDC059224]|uniref:hypothetical protein n=1 Tax=Streptomyces sp. NPDC059224 TaxID=3346775 RepID=UPI003698BFCD